jgi:hypothetical protein
MFLTNCLYMFEFSELFIIVSLFINFMSFSLPLVINNDVLSWMILSVIKSRIYSSLKFCGRMSGSNREDDEEEEEEEVLFDNINVNFFSLFQFFLTSFCLSLMNNKSLEISTLKSSICF